MRYLDLLFLQYAAGGAYWGITAICGCENGLKKTTLLTLVGSFSGDSLSKAADQRGSVAAAGDSFSSPWMISPKGFYAPSF